MVTDTPHVNDELGGTGDVNDRLWTTGSVRPVERSRSVAAQQTSQSCEPQQAEEPPLAGVVVIPGLCSRRWRHLTCPPWGHSWGRLRQRHRGRTDSHDGRQEQHRRHHRSPAGWEGHASSRHADGAHRVGSAALRTGVKDMGTSLLVATCRGGGRPRFWPPRGVFCAPVCRGSRRGGCLLPPPHPHAFLSSHNKPF